MKRVALYLMVCFGVLWLSSSCDKTKLRMEVVKDCTGVYLRNKSGIDYKVCNDELLDGYGNGRKIKVRLDNLNECFGLIEPSPCSDPHVFEGNVEILEIY